MVLSLRRTGLSSPAYRDLLDYVIVEDGRDVERLYEDRNSKPEYRWFWSITVQVDPKLVMNTSGRAATLEETKAQFLQNWEKCQQRPLSRVSYLNESVPRPAMVGPPCATRLQPNQTQSMQLRKLQATSTCLQIIVNTCFAPAPRGGNWRTPQPAALETTGRGLPPAPKARSVSMTALAIARIRR